MHRSEGCLTETEHNRVLMQCVAETVSISGTDKPGVL